MWKLRGFYFLVGGLLLSVSLGLFAAHIQQAPENMDQQLVASLSDLAESSTQQESRDQELQAVLTRLESRMQKDPRDFEASLLKGLIQFRLGNLEQALQELDELTRRAPEFHLAHLVRGDLLLARVNQMSDAGQEGLFSRLDEKYRKQLALLRQEAQVRLQANMAQHLGKTMPRQLLLLGETVTTAIVVDKLNHRLYVYQRLNGSQPPQLVSDHYISTGKAEGNKLVKGDLRTPEGVYFVTSWIPDEQLPQKYGVGAFPVNYPNELDRRQGKTGHGIWLHGTDQGSYSRPPLDSEGCVVLTNAEFNHIRQYIQPGVTPVIIAEQLEWIDQGTWKNERQEILQVIEQWRQDWESLEVEKYLAHYGNDFWSGRHDIGSWSQRKRGIFSNKKFQQVQLSDISIFAYPRSASPDRDMVVIRFRQKYHSNNYNGDIYKRLYLTRMDGQWRILYEGR